MVALLSIATGALIAVMVFVNGRLTAVLGVAGAVAAIHAAGLAIAVLPLVLRRENPFRRVGTPLAYYAGGLIGVLTTLFNNLAFGRISLSALIALGLLGQVLASLAVDRFGLFGFPRRRLHAGMVAGIAAVSGGIFAMLRGMQADGGLPAILSLAAGVTVVASRILNARLAASTSPRVSVFHNFLTGLAAAMVLLCVWCAAGTADAAGTQHTAVVPVVALSQAAAFTASDAWMLSGSLLGFLVVLLSNWTTPRLPAFLVTLFVFVGQVFTGLAVDTLASGRFTAEQGVGGGLVLAGLLLTVLKPASARGYDAGEQPARTPCEP